MASASVAYLGAFTSSYRIDLLTTWEEKCKELEIPSSETFRYVDRYPKNVDFKFKKQNRYYPFPILINFSVSLLY